jgi:hypothetical protein
MAANGRSWKMDKERRVKEIRFGRPDKQEDS